MRARSLAAVLLLAVALRPAPAGAQTSRDWQVCFTSGVLSCTDLFLTTTPQLVGATRTGTFVDVLVRQRTGPGIVSALQDFAFLFPALQPVADEQVALTPKALFGAADAPVDGVWRAATGLTDGAAGPFGTVLLSDTSVPFDRAPDVTPTQWIGGCDGPLDDGLHASPLATCEGGAYELAFGTATVFDADQVSHLALDVYGADLVDRGVPGVASCGGQASGHFATGFDGVDPANATPCTISPATLATVVTPEPPPLLLAAGGLALGGVVVRARRRA